MNNTAATQPDYIAIVLVAALFIVVIVMVIRKWLSDKKAKTVQSAPEVKKEQSTAVAPGSAGHIKLNNVEPRTAAMVMAIVANKTGKPLNELRFISIKEVDE